MSRFTEQQTGSRNRKSDFDQPQTASEVLPSKPAASRRSGAISRPPYKPLLYRLIKAKQAWTDPLDEPITAQGFIGWHQRGYLPHRDAPGLTQFVTFRLYDSFPSARREEWRALLRIEDRRQRRTRLEAYLDRGQGSTWLWSP